MITGSSSSLGLFGAALGGISVKKKEANVTLTLVNSRTTEQERLTEGYARKTDIGFGGGGGAFWGGFAGVGGGGYANTVDDAGWKQFHAHLAEARKHLVKAWELKPNAPEAPSGMIAVVMAEAVDSKETGRLWLDRTIAAQVDYLSA